ncbi:MULTISPECIES: hypothetical protein [Nostocales]|uniref:hypothetical protein n=1 Tax=Nostocales TaxID=1161 RepID=UPI001447119B|nr:MULTISPECIES: hypothetical protein [Nostocales]MBO1066740.1 hypothetical protein [Anabaena sp. 54]
MEIIVYNPCPVRVLLSSILNHHKRDARADYSLIRKHLTLPRSDRHLERLEELKLN